MNRLNVLAMVLAMVLMVACGSGHGKGSVTTTALGDVQGEVGQVASRFVLPAMPDTIPPEPLDAQAAINRAHSQADASYAADRAGQSKHASGVLGNMSDGSLAITSAYPGPGCYAYAVSEPFDAQNIPLVSITGGLAPSAPENWELTYAQVGLVSEAVYQYALDPNGDGDQSDAQPQYMFNQSVLLTYGLDDTGYRRLALTDYNNASGIWEWTGGLAMPFNFRLGLTPNIGGTGGLASMDTQMMFPPEGPYPYGVNNWGWWPEEDLSQARLIVQIYTLNPTLTPGNYPSVNYASLLVTGDVPTHFAHQWPTMGGNLQRTNHVEVAGPQTATLKWVTSGVTLSSDPVVTDTGKIFIQNDEYDLVQVDLETGAWSMFAEFNQGPIPTYPPDSPALGPDGTVAAVGFIDLFLVGPSGAMLPGWPYTENHYMTHNVTIGDTGTVYVNKYPNTLALNPDGTTLWQFSGATSNSQPVIGADGTIYFLFNTTHDIIAFNPDGSIKWALPSTALLGDDHYYPMLLTDTINSEELLICAAADLPTSDSTVYAFAAADGAYRWSLPFGMAWPMSTGNCFASGQNSVIYYSTPFELFAISQAGALLNTYHSPDAIRGCCVVGIDSDNGHDLLYLPTVHGITALRDDFTVKWSDNSLPFELDTMVNPALLSDGSLLVTHNGNLYCYNDDTPQPGNACTVDCRALAGANMSLVDVATGQYISGAINQPTDAVITPALNEGKLFYIEFTPGAAGDLAVFPERADGEAGGYFESTPSGIVVHNGDTGGLPLSEYFTIAGHTITLNANAYSRVTTDLTSVQDALYTLMTPEYELAGMQVRPLSFTAPLPTDTSSGYTVLLAASTRFQPCLQPEPTSTDVRIYPAVFDTGWLEVTWAGTLEEGGTVLGDYFDTAGLVATLQSDAYCRVYSNARGLNNPYGLMNSATHSWIVTPTSEGLTPEASPLDSVVLARGTEYVVRDIEGNRTNTPVIVTAGNTLDYTQTQMRVLDIPNGGTEHHISTVIKDEAPVAALSAMEIYGGSPWLVEFDATASYDPGNESEPMSGITLFEYDFDCDGQYDDSNTTGTIYHNYPGNGSYFAQLRVTDQLGSTDTLDSPLLVNVGPLGACVMYGNDAQRTHRSRYVGPQTNHVVWHTQITSTQQIYTSAVFGDDGTIYVTSWDALLALDMDGGIRWSYPLADYPNQSAAIGEDGTVYISDYNNRLHSINPDGTLKWEIELYEPYPYGTAAGGLGQPPIIGQNGMLYTMSRDYHNFYVKHLHAVDSNGTISWSAELNGLYIGFPSIGSDGMLYVNCDKTLYAIDPDGNHIWQYAAGSIISSSVIGVGGAIYFGSEEGSVYAINPDGTLKWLQSVSYDSLVNPAVGIDGTLYMSGLDSNLYAINPDGSMKWLFPTADSIFSAPTIGADGTVYLSAKDEVYAINQDGSLKWSSNVIVASGRASPVIGSNGELYVGRLRDLYMFRDM